MKIAFIGDSFCGDIGGGTWPTIVAKEYNAEIIAKGLGGRHLFHAYELLLHVVDRADYIIFCISEPFRLPNKYKADIKESLSFAETDSGSLYNTIVTSEPGYPLNKRVIKEIQTAIDGYYKHLISFNWHEIAQKGLVMQIDELMLQKQKKCIWFPCFDSSMQEFIPKSGPIGDTPLEFYNWVHRKRAPGRWNNMIDHMRNQSYNHLNEKDNENMARLIINIIETDNFNPKEIKMKEYFEVLK